ncbi:LemA family protein [Polaribacter pacificus]|nr:LemA family protein [Polaribacter pacificus]
MKKWLPLIVIVVLVFIGYRMVVGFNNTAVKLQENVEEAWGNVETSYQRRNDLIGNLVNTVKGAADFEKSTLTAVVEARAKATSMNIDPSKITPAQLAEFNKVQGGLSGALKSLLVTVERYPDLKANQSFLKLQDELASTENQILTARTRFNEGAKVYNTHIKTFPNTIFAGWFGFEDKPYFSAVEGADKPVEVKF